jgi:hypothetical protein
MTESRSNGSESASPPTAGRTDHQAISLLVVAVAVAFGIGNVIYSASAWGLADINAYWDAAFRLREGQALYPAMADVNAAGVYRYAPWFAAVWIPLTFLPRQIVEILWSIGLLGASLAVALPLLAIRSRAAIALAVLVGSFMVLAASFGNVHALVVASLAFGVERRTGPLWIALATSVKATPILFVLVYLGRREWARAAWAIGIAAALVAPMILLGIADYTRDPGWSHSLYAVSPPLYVLVAASAIAVAAWVARRHPRYAWLATSAAVILALPRYFPYELTYILIGAVPAIEIWRSNRTSTMAAT